MRPNFAMFDSMWVGIEPLLGNVQIQQLDEFRSDVVHDLLGQIIVAKQRDVSFERTPAKTLILGLKVYATEDRR